MFLARIGDDEKVHRIASALFEKDGAQGAAFCRIKGNVQFVHTEVITCNECRASLIKSSLGSLSPAKQKEA
jgi:hypothetical protein